MDTFGASRASSGLLKDAVWQQHVHPDPRCMQLLHRAAQELKPPVCELLLAAGASVNATTTDGKQLTPLLFATNKGMVPSADGQAVLTIAKLLIEHKADAGAEILPSKSTSLEFACNVASEPLVALLLAAPGARVDHVTAAGDTPLHLAIEERISLPIVAVLVNAGADVNPLNNNGPGDTPLHFAILNDNLAAAQLLASYGATRRGDEAQMAMDEGYPAVAAWLDATADLTTAPARGARAQ